MTRTYTDQELAAAVRSTGLGIDSITRLIYGPPTEWTCYKHYISGIKLGQECPDCVRESESLCDCGKGEWCPQFGAAFAAAFRGE